MHNLISDIKEKKLKKIYLLYGDEKYLIRYYRKQLINIIIPHNFSMNLNYFEKDFSYEDMIDTASVYPFLYDKKLLIFDNVDIFKSSNFKIIEYIDKMPDYCYMLFIEDNVDKRTKAYKKLNNIKALVEFKRQNIKALSKWVKAQLKVINMRINDNTLDSLFLLTGDEMDNIYNELQKLISFCYDKKEIEEDDIRKIVVPILSNKIFEMINATIKGNNVKAFNMYKDLLLLKEAPIKILILINRQYMQLLQIKERKMRGCNASEIAVSIKMNPYILKKEYYNMIDNLQMKYLKNCIKLGADLEESVKSGQMNDNLAVEIFLAKIGDLYVA